MVIHSIPKPLAAKATKPYMWGIILRGGKANRLEIFPLLSDGQLVFDPADAGSHPLAHFEGRTIPEGSAEEEQL